MSDPLSKTGPEAQRELLNAMRLVAHGFPRDSVNGAAANIIINAMRQEHPTRAAAERAFDDLFGRMKALLLDHYDASGRKKGVFPYTQVVQPLLLLDKDKMNGG